MKTKNKALLSGPFLVWTAAFIVIPLFMVIYYGFTGEDGSFTLALFFDGAAISDETAVPYGTSFKAADGTTCYLITEGVTTETVVITACFFPMDPRNSRYRSVNKIA